MSLPIKPQSSYMHFVAINKSGVMREHPLAQFDEIANILSTRWKHMAPTEKAKYTTLAKQDRARYRNELEHYQKLAAAGIKLKPAKMQHDEEDDEDLMSEYSSDMGEDTPDVGDMHSDDEETQPMAQCPVPPGVSTSTPPLGATTKCAAVEELGGGLTHQSFLTAVALEEEDGNKDDDDGADLCSNGATFAQYSTGLEALETTPMVVELMPEEFKAFINTVRSNLAVENPGLSYRELARLVTQKWRGLSLEERKDYATQSGNPSDACIRPNDVPFTQTAQMVFCRAQRHLIMQENPGMSYRETAHLCMQKWARLSEQERNFYTP